SGKLGFVITQSVFKTKGGGEGFRALSYITGNTPWFLSPIRVNDLSSFQPFEGATNKTAVIVVTKSRTPFRFPIPYILWRKTNHTTISPDMDLNEVFANTIRENCWAEPVDPDIPTSPWLTAPNELLDVLRKMKGSSTYRARKGVYCATNAVYWLTTATELPGNQTLITNLADTGKK